MAKKKPERIMVTVPLEEFDRLRGVTGEAPRIEVPKGYIVIAKDYYDELYGYQRELAKLKEAETDRKYDVLLAETAEFIALRADAEKWRNRESLGSTGYTSQDVADAALGRLVRQMPAGRSLKNDGVAMWVVKFQGSHYGVFNSPEEALRAALKEPEAPPLRDVKEGSYKSE